MELQMPACVQALGGGGWHVGLGGTASPPPNTPQLLGVPCTPGGQLEGARGVLLPQTSHHEPWLSMSSLCPSSSSSGGDADSMFCFISLDPDQFVAVNGENFKGSELALPGSHWVSWEPPASQQCPWHGFPMATQ